MLQTPEFHYLVAVWWQKFAREQDKKGLAYITGSLGDCVENRHGVGAGLSRETRGKVATTKQAGGDRGGLDHRVVAEADGVRSHSGCLEVWWTVC